jgi:type I restriction enzyme R subunit
MAKAKAYFEKLENTKLPPFKVNIKVHNLLQAFILKGGIDIEEPNE